MSFLEMFEMQCAKAWIPSDLQNSFSKSIEQWFNEIKISKIIFNKDLPSSSELFVPKGAKSMISNKGRKAVIPPKLVIAPVKEEL